MDSYELLKIETIKISVTFVRSKGEIRFTLESLVSPQEFEWSLTSFSTSLKTRQHFRHQFLIKFRTRRHLTCLSFTTASKFRERFESKSINFVTLLLE
jgi:hypothetical protein